jgi:hypothetical protein
MSRKSRGWASAALLTVALSAAGTGVALAATPPTATTGAATTITATSATLNGTVVPNKTPTTYYFQYGKTTSYGLKSATGTANGNASKAVSQTITGLTAATTYHFRLVATNPNGTSNGTDKTFTTTTSAAGGGGGKNAVSIKSTPANITWGRAAVISGQVTGPKSNNQTVTLESTPFPYTKPFKPTGATTTTSNTGAYSFTVHPGQNTRYEVVAATKTPVTSSPVTTGVKVKVIFHVSTLKPARGQLVRFFGTVTPVHNGKFAQIQRRTSTGTWKTVASTKLLAGGKVNGTAISKYSKRLRVNRNGTYRVRVNPHDGNHLTGNSATHTERVH